MRTWSTCATCAWTALQQLVSVWAIVLLASLLLLQRLLPALVRRVVLALPVLFRLADGRAREEPTFRCPRCCRRDRVGAPLMRDLRDDSTHRTAAHGLLKGDANPAPLRVVWASSPLIPSAICAQAKRGGCGGLDHLGVKLLDGRGCGTGVGDWCWRKAREYWTGRGRRPPAGPRDER